MQKKMKQRIATAGILFCLFSMMWGTTMTAYAVKEPTYNQTEETEGKTKYVGEINIDGLNVRTGFGPDYDVLVVNGGNEETIKIGECANARVKTFSAKQKALVHLNGDMICYGEEEVLNIKDIKIPGLHNVENYMTAICAVHDMVSLDTIRKVAKTFGGFQHRIELVRIKDGVKYYNSSIDSSPNRTINTLKVFPERVILITGGKDKGIPYDEIGPHIIDKVKTLVLIGATAPLIEDALNKAYAEQGITPFIDVFHAESYEQAVNLAYKNAKENDVVLLSPASTSFDMFKNFEERGNCFKELVMKL